MGPAHSCRIATTDSNSDRNAKSLPPRPAACATISTAVNNPPPVAPEKQRRAFLPRNSLKKRFSRKPTPTNTMNAAAQPPAPANSPQRQSRAGIIIDLISDDEEDEYADAHEQVVAHQPHINLDQYDFMANDDLEILRDIPIHPPPPAANPDPGIHANPPFRRRSIFDEYGYDGEVEVLPNNPNLPGLPAANPDPWRQPNLHAGNNNFFGDYVFDDEMNEEDLVQAAQAIIDLKDYDNQPFPRLGPAAVSVPAAALAPRRPSNPEPDFPFETKDECITQVLEVFGDICRDHVSGLYDNVSKSSERILAYIVDKIEKGESYPKAKVLKRKRQFTEYEEAAQKYATADRIIPPNYAETRQLIRKIVQTEFSDIPMSYIDEVLNQEGYRLFTAYLALEKSQRTYDPRQPTYNKLKSSRKMGDEFKDAKIEELIRITDDEAKKDVYRELQAVRRTRQKDDAERQARHSAALDEEENVRRAVAEGTMLECGCCCDDFPLNRMIHCDNENSKEMHWFCRGCALKAAEEEAGSGKYELFCMSMNRCTAGFSRDQRAIFLTESITKVLDGNEQETNLRLAGIVNLARCHACSFAAECPPIELDFEFRCPNPECREVTCRRCKEKSHTPKTCEEAKENKGLSLHHLVAESMSEGVIRKCNKCASPFIKEEGCNKMTCTRCGNIQCYVCSQNCQYDHFNDTSRGGKQGNCPLFDNSDERHANDRDKAKKERIAAIRSEHPEYTEEELDIKMSEEVQKDDEKRRSNNPRAQMQARMGELRARAVALGGAREGMRAAAVVDFEDIRPMPMAPRRPLIRRRAAPPPAVPEPPVLHPNRHIYRGHFDAPVLPDFPDLPPPPPEPDFDDAAFEAFFGDPLFRADADPGLMDFRNHPFPLPARVDPAAQPANQPGVQGIAPFPAVPRPQLVNQYRPLDFVDDGEAVFRRLFRADVPVVPGVGGLPNAEPAPLIAGAPQPPFPGNEVRQAIQEQQQVMTQVRLQRERSRQRFEERVRAAHDLGILPNDEANANGQFLRNFADPEPWMRRQNQEAAALARQRVQVEGAQNGAGNPGPGVMNDEHALLRERQQEIIDRVNEQHASVRDRQREIIVETDRRIQRRAELERLMREDEDGEGVIERAMAGIRERGNIPDAGLREVEEELRGMDGLWQWR